METLTTTLLGLWRLAASHGRLDEVIEEIAAGLRRHVTFERLLILDLDQEQARLKPAAQCGVTPAVPGQGLHPCHPSLPCAAGAWVTTWPRGGSRRSASGCPVWCQRGGRGTCWRWAWPARVSPWGPLLLGTDWFGGLGSPQAPRVLALREPIAVALRNHLRLKELTALREAAEADRRSLLARLGRQEITDTLIGGGSGLKAVMRGVELVAPATAPV